MTQLKVTRTISEGIAMGKAFLVHRCPLEPETYTITQVHQELEKLDRAICYASEQLKNLAITNTIFQAHLELVNDQDLLEEIREKIEKNQLNVQMALWETVGKWILLFEKMDDEYMRERVADVKDIRNRLMYILKQQPCNPFEEITEEVIVVAENLTPSDTAMLDMKYVTGVITQEGGITSHVSIMAKNLGLPALVGVDRIMSKATKGDYIIMDAKAGVIIINPVNEVKEVYKEKKLQMEEQMAEYQQVLTLPTCTKDGKKIILSVNIGSVEDAKQAAAKGQKRVGLFRSESLYMESNHFPSENEQLRVYKEILQLCGEELTIRTLDIGGDKGLSYFKFEKEENPFLGWRGIRICLDMRKMFKEQLRAVLRVSEFGNVRLLIPMIISIGELRTVKELLEECKEELRREKVPFREDLPIGMMVETPASVILADTFAREVDFFSIGTNDLTQYMLAIDRGNTKLAEKYNFFHPAVLASIEAVIEAGHRAGIKVGMCGEMASLPEAIEILLKMGLDEFSVATSCVAKTKYFIRKTSTLLK